MYKISVLTIGDEICIGQIINTNASWISGQCTSAGAKVLLHSSIGDNLDMITSELGRLGDISDMVIITGGLGPTEDDITKSALCRFFSDHLELHEPTCNYLTESFKIRGRTFSDSNRSQAMLPSSCTALSNSVGTAPGMLFKREGRIFISLPGVPSEVKAIMNSHVVGIISKEIKKNKHKVVLYKTLLTSGMPESALAEKIGLSGQFPESATLAYLPSYSGVRLRIGVESGNADKAQLILYDMESKLRQRIGEYIYGEGSDSLENAVGRILVEQCKTIAVAESCTAGLLGKTITNSPGSSSYFRGGLIAYSNEIKIREVGVNQQTIIEHGAVSKDTAIELANNIRDKFDTDLGISITGIAGPGGGTAEKPVGTIWIGLSDKNGTQAKKYVFGKHRNMNRELAVTYALSWLHSHLR